MKSSRHTIKVFIQHCVVVWIASCNIYLLPDKKVYTVNTHVRSSVYYLHPSFDVGNICLQVYTNV